MSVMLLEDKHFNAIVDFARKYRKQAIVTKSGKSFDMQNPEDCQAVASILLAANVAAYDARYGEQSDEAITYSMQQANHTPVEILKALDVLEYQIDDEDTSDAHDIINTIRRTAITKLVGYEDAPWGIE